MQTRAGVLVVFAVAAAAWNPPTAAQAATTTWTIDGVQRQALVFPPTAKTPTGKAPVVFAFHGHGGNMQSSARAMEFQNVWPQALVVYMQGLPSVAKKVDPEGLKPGWQHEPGELGDRDLKFFDAVLARIRKEYPVDDARIYACGFSNGGFFSYLLWAERGQSLTAVASCAGRISPTLHLTEPKPVLQISGESDRVVAFADQLDTIEALRHLNGASTKGEPCGKGCTLYRSSNGTPVMTFIHPGGHVYPAGATELIVRFFKEHGRKQ